MSERLTDVEPVPVQLGAWGCPLMVRTDVGQWTTCRADPAFTVVDRDAWTKEWHRLFLCRDHAVRYPNAVPMGDEDFAELAGRQVQLLEGLAGRRFEPVGAVTSEDPEGL